MGRGRGGDRRGQEKGPLDERTSKRPQSPRNWPRHPAANTQAGRGQPRPRHPPLPSGSLFYSVTRGAGEGPEGKSTQPPRDTVPWALPGPARRPPSCGVTPSASRPRPQSQRQDRKPSHNFKEELSCRGVPCSPWKVWGEVSRLQGKSSSFQARVWRCLHPGDGREARSGALLGVTNRKERGVAGTSTS